VGRYQTVAGLESNADAAYFVDWFLKGLGSLSCERLIVSESTSGQPGQSLQPLKSPALHDAAVCETIFRTLSTIGDDLRGKAEQLNRLQLDLNNRLEENRLLVADKAQVRTELDRSRRENEDLRRQLAAVRRRATDNLQPSAQLKQNARDLESSSRIVGAWGADVGGVVNLPAVVPMSEQLAPKLIKALAPVIEQRIDLAVKRSIDTQTKTADVVDDGWVKWLWFFSGAAAIAVVAAAVFLVVRLLSH
jgi:hypothetical protein